MKGGIACTRPIGQGERLFPTCSREYFLSRAGIASSNSLITALDYVGLGDNDRAMTWLTTGYQARFNPSILMRPGFDPLRSDPRFLDLLHRIGLASRDPITR